MNHEDPIPALKRQLGAELALIASERNGDDLASLLGTDRSRIADLRRGTLTRFSLETLIRFVERHGSSVELRVTRRRFNSRQ